MLIALEIQDGKVAIKTPYNPAFVARVKAIGACWNPDTKTWIADERNIEAVRAAMRKVYGQDDRPQTLVSVRVTVTQEFCELTGPIVLFGRPIAGARGRDTGARIGEGVAFEVKAPQSGGSIKYWETVIPKGAVFVIHDVPQKAIEAQIGWRDAIGSFEIIQSHDIDTVALQTEREGLLARLVEIDHLLNKTP